MFIKEVSIGNWGPLDRFQVLFEHGVFLIYGENESGKTSLVEAILSALAKDPEKVIPFGRWDDDFRGNVLVRLHSKDGSDILMRFPSKKNKSDKYLRMRLLFSWAGEVESAQIISQLLCFLLLPNYILSWNPMEGMGLSDIMDGKLIGHKRGKYKLFSEKLSQLNNIVSLEEEFYQANKVDVLRLEKERDELIEKKNALIELKKKFAYKIYRRLKEIEKRLSQHPKERIEELMKLKVRFDELTAAISSIEKVEPNDDETLWWQGIVDELKEISAKRSFQKFIVWGIGLLIMLLSVIFSNTILRFVLLILGVAIFLSGEGIFEYLEKKRRYQEIFREIEKRSGISFVSLKQVLDYFEHLKQKEYYRKMKLQEKEKLLSERLIIEGKIRQIVLDRDVNEYIEEERILIHQLEEEWKELYGKFREIGISEDELESYSDELLIEELRDYNSKEEEWIDRRIAEINSILAQVSMQWAALSGKIGFSAQEGISYPKRLFLKLKSEKKNKIAELRDIVSVMVSAVAWKNVLERKKEKMFEEVSQVVSGGVFKQFLSSVFGTEEISVEVTKDNVFLVRNGLKIPFDWLSCGTKHQLLFALKSAMAYRIYDEPMFFILDDVFVFSDECRIEKQITGVFGMADMGWQIIYLTGNPWIRDKFKSYGAKIICL